MADSEFDEQEDSDSSDSDDELIHSDRAWKTRGAGHPFKAATQSLSLRGKNLTSLDFLSKYMQHNHNIVDIDIGENPLTDQEIKKFSD